MACLGTGTQTSHIGPKQANVPCKFIRNALQSKENRNKYSFGEQHESSLASIVIRIRIIPSSTIATKADVVNENVPLSIGMDFLNKYNLYGNKLRNLLCISDLILSVLVVSKRDQMYSTKGYGSKALFTHKELSSYTEKFPIPHQTNYRTF